MIKISLVCLLLVTSCLSSQDMNSSGIINRQLGTFDLNGDGIVNQYDNSAYKFNIPVQAQTDNSSQLSFVNMWQSPAGAFTNCWDGIVGYFDSDTLLDVAGFTFSPAKFYIYEQSASNPNTFTQVQEFIKAEGGSYGPITLGDTDGDSKLELITADVLGIARVYIYECDADNTYIAQPTFSHPSNSEGGQGIYVADMNKNGKKEIVVLRGTSSGGEVNVWEQSGAIGSNTYTKIYTYTTVSYVFSKGGMGDSDNDGWDEVFLGLGGLPTFNTFIRRIEFDSVSQTFQYSIFEAPSIGLPASYKVFDLDNDGIKELIMTGNSNSRAACYVFRSNGANSYLKIDSVFEASDNNNMLSSDIRILTGNSLPTLLMGSFNGRVYTYQFDGTRFVKDYENLSYPGAAIRRVYWLPTTTYDGYFNTWSSTNSDGTFFIFKRDATVGIVNNNSPAGFRLMQNYPNPFNPATVISYDIPKTSLVSLRVFDINGKLVTTLVDRTQAAGNHSVQFNSSDLSSGIYFYTLNVNGITDTKAMILVK